MDREGLVFVQVSSISTNLALDQLDHNPLAATLDQKLQLTHEPIDKNGPKLHLPRCQYNTPSILFSHFSCVLF